MDPRMQMLCEVITCWKFKRKKNKPRGRKKISEIERIKNEFAAARYLHGDKIHCDEVKIADIETKTVSTDAFRLNARGGEQNEVYRN